MNVSIRILRLLSRVEKKLDREEAIMKFPKRRRTATHTISVDYDPLVSNPGGTIKLIITDIKTDRTALLSFIPTGLQKKRLKGVLPKTLNLYQAKMKDYK